MMLMSGTYNTIKIATALMSGKHRWAKRNFSGNGKTGNGGVLNAAVNQHC